MSDGALKEWVWLEGRREFQFESYDFVEFIFVLLPAFITPNQKRTVDNRWRRESISLSERDFMSRVDVHVAMNLYIPANDNPGVNRGLPVIPCRHAGSLKPVVRENVLPRY